MSRTEPSRRDDLLVMLLHGGAATNSIARFVVDKFAAEVRAEVEAEKAAATDESAKQALSDAGAQCGDCGDQPGDRICPDCERCYGWYVAALRKAGWAPRTEVLNEAADWLASVGEANAAYLLRTCDVATPAATPVPVKTAGDETGEPLCRCGHLICVSSRRCGDGSINGCTCKGGAS